MAWAVALLNLPEREWVVRTKRQFRGRAARPWFIGGVGEVRPSPRRYDPDKFFAGWLPFLPPPTDPRFPIRASPPLTFRPGRAAGGVAGSPGGAGEQSGFHSLAGRPRRRGDSPPSRRSACFSMPAISGISCTMQI